MSSEQFSEGANAPVARAVGPQASWGRPLAISAAVVFFVSSAFPVVAGLSKNTAAFPKWWGTLDVGLAFALAGLAFAVMAAAQDKEDMRVRDASYRAYRILIHGILVMLVAFFLLGDRIVWINCLTGFAWRAWLFVYVLPAWLTALRSGSNSRLTPP